MPEATFSVFSDADSAGWAEAFAALLREGGSDRVDIADSLDAVFDGDADVLILNLDRERDTTLSADRIDALKRCRIIAMAPGADWLCAQLDEIEFRGGNVTDDLTMLVADSELLGKQSAEPIRPWRVQKPRLEAWPPGMPRIYFSGGIADYRPGVDDILVPEQHEDCAVVVRQASFVFAGVQAHPDEWSEQYRALIRRVAVALAERPVEALEPIVVERQIHPPGSVRFELEPISEKQSGSHRNFYFRFERPAAFTATLEHVGSNAMAMYFGGGKEFLHGARVDTEDGKTLTIAANIGGKAIQAVGYRHWLLGVQNFDHENACSAKLTVRYDTTSSGSTVRALPGNASFEYVNGAAWDLSRAAQTIGIDVARLATAREHGFEAWGDLEAHVAWTPVFDMRGGTRGADRFDARVRVQYGESYTLAQLIEYAEDFTDELRLALSGALSGDETFSDEHLLLTLLDDPIAAHALRCAGADTDILRSQLRAPAGDGGVRNVAKAVSGAVYRANFIGAIGREGTNSANLLAGLLGESCAATNRLKDQGIQQRDIVNYVTHGLPRVAVENQEPAASVFDEQVEQVAQAAFAKARDQTTKYVTLDRLLLALIAHSSIARVLRSMDARVDALEGELRAYVDATVVGVGDDDVPQPTRALNRVMQMAVAKARSAGRPQATTLDVLWALCGERDVPTADILGRFEITRADVAARMG
ncbi:MAG: hypothetical protein OXG82_16395 [Gammaproteobacteria bacterium]|nr:hypothetical protein [Gammaproteobacteria bacterium]